MLERRTMHRFALAVVFVAGCVSRSSSPGGDPDGSIASLPLPSATGSYAGRYTVPTGTELAAAADFAVAEVDWLVTGNTVTLEYGLPVGLVGGSVRVSLAGQLGAPGDPLTLVGAAGTGTCTSTSATAISCREQLTGLGTLPISMDVVRQTAAVDYAGPIADRVAVATLFGSDPIGFVDIDLGTPVPFGSDDHGGGGGHGSN